MEFIIMMNERMMMDKMAETYLRKNGFCFTFLQVKITLVRSLQSAKQKMWRYDNDSGGNLPDAYGQNFQTTLIPSIQPTLSALVSPPTVCDVCECVCERQTREGERERRLRNVNGHARRVAQQMRKSIRKRLCRRIIRWRNTIRFAMNGRVFTCCRCCFYLVSQMGTKNSHFFSRI